MVRRPPLRMVRRSVDWLVAARFDWGKCRSGFGEGYLRSRDIIVKSLQDLARQGFSHDLFQGADDILIIRCNQGKGIPGAFGAAGPADAVDVIVSRGGHVEVDDMRDTLHVQAARRNISGHHDLVLAALEAAQRALPLPLRSVAMQAGDFEAGPLDLL